MILVKFPTRQRPKQFLNCIKGYMKNQENNVHYLISYDEDDTTMGSYVIDECKNWLPAGSKLTMVRGKSHSKIHACNRDIDKVKDWNVLVLASDDMICQVKGWDRLINENMEKHYPDKDGVLYFPDGYTQLNTMCIMGKTYYDRFDYIYNPNYISLWCDNEFHEVADKLGRQTKVDVVLFKHEHPANNNQHMDLLYKSNDRFYRQDKQTYENRKKRNFGL